MLTQLPEVVHIPDLPIAANICGQMLREIGYHDDSWSIAHVVMNPGAWSFLHQHEYMEELYAITRGTGLLTVGDKVLLVSAGDAVRIPPRVPHRLANMGVGMLEHFVMATPPFDADDVEVLDQSPYIPHQEFDVFRRPKLVEAMDGASLVEYEFFLSTVAFGFSKFAAGEEKRPHYHKINEEWIFVADGAGIITLDGERRAVASGDLVKIPSRTRHAIESTGPSDIVVVCVSYPGFNPEDVYYDSP